MKKLYFFNSILGLLLLLLLLACPLQTSAQVPVADFFGRSLSKITSTVQQVSETINRIAEPFVNTFETVQSFFVQTETIVNGLLRNMQLLQHIVNLQADIQGYYDETLLVLNAPRDQDGDGEDDLGWLDKWKHLNILLGLFKESSGLLELLTNVLSDDALTMDDYNRLTLLKETRHSLLKVKTAMRIERQRINREVLHFGRLERERNTFNAFFE